MIIFVDASALIAIMAGESDADALAEILETYRRRLCSALSVWETAAGLSRCYGLVPADAWSRVQAFLDAADATFVTIGNDEAHAAAQAYARFGRGRHKAALNMGDCFAYACAKLNRARLLYKGDDFTWTDLA